MKAGLSVLMAGILTLLLVIPDILLWESCIEHRGTIEKNADGSITIANWSVNCGPTSIPYILVWDDRYHVIACANGVGFTFTDTEKK